MAKIRYDNPRIGTPGRPRDPKGRLLDYLQAGSPGQNTADPDFESPAVPERQIRSMKSNFVDYTESEEGTGSDRA